MLPGPSSEMIFGEKLSRQIFYDFNWNVTKTSVPALRNNNFLEQDEHDKICDHAEVINFFLYKLLLQMG